MRFLLKFRYFEKATTLEKKSPAFSKLLSNVKTIENVFVALSEYLNFRNIDESYEAEKLHSAAELVD